MTYIARSCIPKSDCLTGKLLLEEDKETIPYIADLAYLGLSTVFYPALFAISLIAELYLLYDLHKLKQKSQKIDRKIAMLTNASDDEISTLKLERTSKLLTRLLEQKATVEKINGIFKSYDPLSQALIDKVKHCYTIAKTKANLSSATSKEQSQLLAWEKNVKWVRAYERTDEEMSKAYYFLPYSEVKKVMLDRLKFSKTRNQIAQLIDTHYLSFLLKCQIPIIGLIYQVHSGYTTRTALEQTPEVAEYHKALAKYSWLKPYGVSCKRSSVD